MSERPDAARRWDDSIADLEAYEARMAPSQYKWLRLQRERREHYDAATRAWRYIGWEVAEALQKHVKAELAMRSLDFSNLYFPPFCGFETAFEGLPITHLRVSTGRDPHETPPHMALGKLFEKTRDLRCFEVVPQRHGSAYDFCDSKFETDKFCLALRAALELGYAPKLTSLRLDFSKEKGTVVQDTIAQLMSCIHRRTALVNVNIAWPGGDSAAANPG